MKSITECHGYFIEYESCDDFGKQTWNIFIHDDETGAEKIVGKRANRLSCVRWIERRIALYHELVAEQEYLKPKAKGT